MRSMSKKQKAALLLWALLCAFVILFLCSKSSPLYPMNDWVDVNCFFTVGRGILQGKMPYMDLYEQKGPVLYLFFAAAALVSENSFLGVFLLEGICFGLFIYLTVQIVSLWLGNRPLLLYLLPPVLALSIAVSPAFTHGSSAEELFLPAMALFLKVTLTAIHEDRALSKPEAFLCGALGALALWVKYTFCGIFVGGAVALSIWYCVTGKGRQLWTAMLFALLGVMAVTVPLLLWFWARGALPDLWQVYFVNNLTSYAAGRSPRHDPPLIALKNNWMWSVPAIIGCLWPLSRFKRGWSQALLLICSAVTLGIFTYANGRTYPYYALILCVFAGLGYVPLLQLLQRLTGRIPMRPAIAAGAVVSAVLLLACSLGAYRWSNNIYLAQYEKEDMPPYRFAALIQEADDASLLNLGFLDGGFYFASGVEPDNRFFCTFNISLQEQDDEQKQLIEDGAVRFIVVRGKKSPGRHYELIDQCSYPFEGRNWTYCLYRLRESNSEAASTHRPVRMGG